MYIYWSIIYYHVCPCVTSLSLRNTAFGISLDPRAIRSLLIIKYNEACNRLWFWSQKQNFKVVPCLSKVFAIASKKTRLYTIHFLSYHSLLSHLSIWFLTHFSNNFLNYKQFNYRITVDG